PFISRPTPLSLRPLITCSLIVFLFVAQEAAPNPTAGGVRSDLMKFTAIVEGQPVEIEVNRTENDVIEAEIGGRSYRLEAKAVEPGGYWFIWNNRSLEITVTQNRDSYVASLAGHRIAVEILDARTALRRAAQHGHDGAVQIRAPMPGKVIKVLVAEGTEVLVSQGIVVIEARRLTR